MSLPGVPEEELRLLCKILKKFLDPSVFPVHAFGSRTTSGFRENSDLDLYIDSPTPIPGHILVELRSALEESRLSFRVDLLEKSALAPRLLSSIEALPKIRICAD